jgi:hypothetical protein
MADDLIRIAWCIARLRRWKRSKRLMWFGVAVVAPCKIIPSPLDVLLAISRVKRPKQPTPQRWRQVDRQVGRQVGWQVGRQVARGRQLWMHWAMQANGVICNAFSATGASRCVAIRVARAVRVWLAGLPSIVSIVRSALITVRATIGRVAD